MNGASYTVLSPGTKRSCPLGEAGPGNHRIPPLLASRRGVGQAGSVLRHPEGGSAPSTRRTASQFHLFLEEYELVGVSHGQGFLTMGFSARSAPILFRQAHAVNLNRATDDHRLVQSEVVTARPPVVLLARHQPLTHLIQVHVFQPPSELLRGAQRWVSSGFWSVAANCRFFSRFAGSG